MNISFKQTDDEFLPAEVTDQPEPLPQRQPEPQPGCNHEHHNIPEYVTLEQNYPGHLTPQPENVTLEHSPRDVNDRDMVARVGKSIITPSMIQPFPKSSSNNSSKGTRKRNSTTIPTNTPIMKQMEIEYDERMLKKIKSMKKNFSPIVMTKKKEEKVGENTTRDNETSAMQQIKRELDERMKKMKSLKEMTRTRTLKRKVEKRTPVQVQLMKV
ncbi:hypothetical protein HHI36_013446 [Cryptolaemus montrouzieri]|uniref:Uncharacterized protein n=1 Tax=Cryptolaemus montrouzieri TaxID=559131 RepID=A0ABD2NHD3_9CUCU